MLYKKLIDKSLLKEGFTIPKFIYELIKKNQNWNLKYNQKKAISISIDGSKFEAIMKNQQFNKEKYPNHYDIVQVRYSKNNPFAKKLQKMYDGDINKKSLIVRFNEEFSIDIYPYDEMSNEKLFTKEEKQSEQVYESTINNKTSDIKARIVRKKVFVNQRIYDRRICNQLKRLYNNKCQICGFDPYKEINEHVSEAHHIEYFTKSCNNNANNILILCPNHHRIIHKANPEFSTDKLEFHFKNGYTAKIMTNNHL